MNKAHVFRTAIRLKRQDNSVCPSPLLVAQTAGSETTAVLIEVLTLISDPDPRATDSKKDAMQYYRLMPSL